jgi:hypothetical protein
MNYFLTQKVKGTTYYFQIMGIYVVLHSRNISNTYITTLPNIMKRPATNQKCYNI